MKLVSYSPVLLVLFVLVSRSCANPAPQGEAEESNPQPGDGNPGGESAPESVVKPEPEVDAAKPSPDAGGAKPASTAGAAAAGAAVPEECDTDCKLSHQTTIIIFICILVCIILLIVILFFCYFMKKLHGKALLTADHNQIIRRGPTTRTYLRPDEFSETKQTETYSVPGDNPNESKVITTTTTKIVSKSTDEQV